ncbi:aspartate aminotransferase [Cephaloticoccus primus]|uniref:Histidinol-phosphate aminotransferase n=1 Tax=Cephaloticoccus primus TaxID=1548207 RepID=A0A139STP5_9BACT|nr:histidinol-phosphate transaminase [Cephaloticoccus primus]KXU37852.1 aspartate aminotransferase [Cephaloticoccus primus]
MTTLAALARPEVEKQPVYEPGKPIEDVARELGLDVHHIVKLASNENPFGGSPLGLAAAQRALAQAELYPDGDCVALRARLAQHWGLSPRQFVIGNGSNEIIELLGHVFLRAGDEVVMGDCAFVVYRLVTLLFGAKPVTVPMRLDRAHDLDAMAAAVTPRTRLVFVASPNNPTGAAHSPAELLDFARALPGHVVLCVDEAYAEYLDPAAAPDLRPLLAEGRAGRAGGHVIGLRTFSKIYGLAGLRIGYGYASEALAALLNRVRQPFNVNAISQAAACAALGDVDFVARCRRENAAGLRQLAAGLDAQRVEYAPSVANFLLIKVGDGARCFQWMQTQGMIVRPVAAYGLPEWIRLTVGTAEQNARFLGLLAEFLKS